MEGLRAEGQGGSTDAAHASGRGSVSSGSGLGSVVSSSGPSTGSVTLPRAGTAGGIWRPPSGTVNGEGGMGGGVEGGVRAESSAVRLGRQMRVTGSLHSTQRMKLSVAPEPSTRPLPPAG